jgi:hypothetical protein
MTETLWLLRFKSVLAKMADGGMGNDTLLQEYASTIKITFENTIITTGLALFFRLYGYMAI